MTTGSKIPFKQAEVSLRRFNEQAIPHHLGLLKNHRSNIEKSLALGDWNKIKKEEVNALRVIKQVKNLLLEMDALREKVCEEDLNRFDIMLEIGKQQAYEGMREYMELQLKSPTSTIRSQSSIIDENIAHDNYNADNSNSFLIQQQQHLVPQIESNFQEIQLAQRQACFEELERLQHEIRDLNDMFRNMHELVQEQAVSVQTIVDNAEEALENVQEGERNLSRALKYQKAMYPVVGALLGTCVGGPIGLVAGLKAGGLAAVGCGILGFTGGSVLKSNSSILHGNIEEQLGQSEQVQEDLELQRKNE